MIEESRGNHLAKSLKEAGFKVVGHDPMASGPAKMFLGIQRSWSRQMQEAIGRSESP